MPTYVYRGLACAHQFEQFQKMSDDPLTVCPECGGPVQRVIHPVGIVFKGSGWYITDSRKSSSNGKSEESAKTTTNGDKSADKPATEAKKTSESTSTAAKETTPAS